MKLESLRGKDLRETWRKGKRIKGRLFNLIYSPGEDRIRLAVVVRKKLGKAVLRNRLKRLVKEAMRHEGKALEKGFDIILSLKEESTTANFDEMKAELSKVLERMKKG